MRGLFASLMQTMFGSPSVGAIRDMEATIRAQFENTPMRLGTPVNLDAIKFPAPPSSFSLRAFSDALERAADGLSETDWTGHVGKEEGNPFEAAAENLYRIAEADLSDFGTFQHLAALGVRIVEALEQDLNALAGKQSNMLRLRRSLDEAKRMLQSVKDLKEGDLVEQLTVQMTIIGVAEDVDPCVDALVSAIDEDVRSMSGAQRVSVGPIAQSTMYVLSIGETVELPNLVLPSPQPEAVACTCALRALMVSLCHQLQRTGDYGGAVSELLQIETEMPHSVTQLRTSDLSSRISECLDAVDGDIEGETRRANFVVIGDTVRRTRQALQTLDDWTPPASATKVAVISLPIVGPKSMVDQVLAALTPIWNSVTEEHVRRAAQTYGWEVTRTPDGLSYARKALPQAEDAGGASPASELAGKA